MSEENLKTENENTENLKENKNEFEDIFEKISSLRKKYQEKINNIF